MQKASKVAQLTREQKLELLAAAEERKRRKADRREAFTPHLEQAVVMAHPAKERIVVCGNGWGKTAYGANEALCAVNGYNPHTKQYTPVPAKVYVVLDAPEKVADVWLPELRKWQNIGDDQLHKLGKPYYSKISFPNGSEIRFMFHLMEPLAFESLESDLVVLDEPPPHNIWIALLRSGRKKGRKPRFLLLGTPISQPWLREYYNDWVKGQYPNSHFFKGSTDANRANLADGYIEDFAIHLTEREKATRLHGDFFNTEGMALAGLFKRDVHVAADIADQALREGWPCVLALDPHPQKPTHGIVLAAGPGGHLHYVAERAAKQVPRDWAKWVKANWLEQFNIVDIVTDNFGSGDFTGGEGFSSFIEVWRAEGIKIRPTSYDEKKDDEFLERIQEALYINEQGDSKLRIDGSCVGIINDIENVQWKSQKGTEEYQPKLEIGNKDYLSCLKYALAAGLTYDNSKRRIHRPPGIARQHSRVERKSQLGYMEERQQAKFRKKQDDWDDF